MLNLHFLLPLSDLEWPQCELLGLPPFPHPPADEYRLAVCGGKVLREACQDS